jgi:WD40 repeat protein
VPAHDGAALSVAFSATDQVLATTGQDGTLLIWSMVDPSAPQRVGQAASSDGSAINSVAAYPGRADLLATGGADGRALLWSTADPQSGPTVLTEAIVRDGPVTQVGFRQGGLRTELVAASADQSITLVDLTDPTTIDGEPTELRGHSSDVVSVAVRADGLVLASGGADSDVILWNPDRRRSGYLGPVRRFEGAATAITGEIEFVRGDDTIVTTGPEGTIPIWRASGVQPSGAAPGAPKGDAVRSSDFAEEGSLLATTDGSSVTIWDTTDPLQAQRFGTLDARARYTTIALSSDGTLLAVGTEDGAVDLWSVSTPTSPRRLSTVTTYEDRATAVAFGAEGRLATSGDEGTVDLWDVTDPGQPERRGGPWTEHAQPVLAIAFNSTGSTFVTAGEDSQAILWSATDTPGMLGRPLGGHTLGVSDARFAARDQYLITIDGDRSVVLWDVVETARPARIGELLQTDPGETPRTMDIAASEDLVAVGAESGVVYLLALSDLDLVRDRAVGDACLHAGQLDVEEWEAAVPGIGFEPTCEGR